MVSRAKPTPIRKKIRRTAKRHVRMAVVPHRDNQYKPHLIRRHGLIAVLLVVIAAQFIGQSGLFHRVLGDKAAISVPELLAETNRERTRAGSKTLTLNPQLSDAAYYKAKDMLANQYWSHTSPTGVEPWRWIGDAGYNYVYAGENLARNFATSSEVVRAWMRSPSHRDNMLKAQYQDVGFATVMGMLQGREVSLVVAMYGTPATGDVLASLGSDKVLAPIVGQTSVASRIGTSLQMMDPLVLSSIVLVLFTACVALVAHTYRRHIPKYIQNTWQRHHGLAKALALSSFVIVFVMLYGSAGQLL